MTSPMPRIATILFLAEDDEDARYIEAHLNLMDYRVVRSSNGNDGLSLARTLQPDVIILDMLLPGLPGIPLLNSLKGNEKTKNIPVILLAQKGEAEEVKILALSSGASDFMEKPAEVVSLGVKIRNILELEFYRHSLENANEELQRGIKMKSAFLANMSHDIRTPLNAILGFTDLLINDESDADKLEFLRIIKNSGGLLLELINDILDLSRVESGFMKIENVSFDLEYLADNIAANTRMLISRAANNVEFHVSISKDISQYIQGDSLRLRQILNNLLSNAVKFTDAGSIELKIQRENDFLKFSITDTGTGIPEDRQEVIFDPFQQAEASTARNYGGTGLGLSISKKLTELMGGTLTLRSPVQDGRGSCFSFTLPYMPSSTQPGADMKAPSTNNSMNPSTRILLAEDNIVNQMLARKMLEKAGYRIQTVNNGLEALETFQKDRDIGVILMDVQMPIMDGLEATRKIREHEKETSRGRIPIIALTAAAMEEDRQACLEAGCDDFISKPVNLDKLTQALETSLGEKKHARNADSEAQKASV